MSMAWRTVFSIQIRADRPLHKGRGIRRWQHLLSEDSKKGHEECRKNCWTDSDPHPANSWSHQTALTHYCPRQHEWNEHYACLGLNEEWRPQDWVYITEKYLTRFLSQGPVSQHEQKKLWGGYLKISPFANLTLWLCYSGAKLTPQSSTVLLVHRYTDLLKKIMFLLVRVWSLSVST